MKADNTEESRWLFAQRIGELIGDAGSVSELARICDFSEGVVRSWRDGKSDPSRERLIVLADRTGVRLEWLATGQGPKYAADLAEARNTDDEKYAIIPLYNVTAAAGGGALVEREEIVEYLRFPQSWLRQLHLSAGDLKLMYVDGDSMTPDLWPGDPILVNCGDQTAASEGVYVLRLDSALLVKQLQRLPGDRIRAVSKNPMYAPFELKLSDFNGTSNAIIGRVVIAVRRM